MLGRTLRLLVWIASVLAAIGYVSYAVRGLPGAAPRDPIEATILDHASRFAVGESPYLDPGHQPGAPLMPVFPLVIAPLVAVFDAQPWVPRALNLLAVLLTAAVVGWVVRKETGNGTLGAGSAGMWLMAQILTNVPRAAAHPETLMLLFAMLGALALRYGTGLPTALAGAVALALAAFTHPTGLFFAIAGIAHLAWMERRRLIAYATAVGLLVAGAHVACSLAWGPWFNYAAWDRLFLLMRFDPAELVGFVGAQLVGTLGMMSLSLLLAFALPVKPWRGATGLWTWMGFAALLAGMITSQSTLSPGDALRPAAMLLAVVGPISMDRVTRHLSVWPGSSRLGGQRVIHAALAIQFLALLAHIAPAVVLAMV
jgi:hypothetical protein